MARTRLFSMAQRALALSDGDGRALTRRQALAFGAVATLAACSPMRPQTNIAVVGGGIAGLVAAYRLAQAGKTVTLYEAGNRFGGRMFTLRKFNAEGMFCELGGELVDSNHLPLISLAHELGVGIQRLKSRDAEDIYHMGGALHREREMMHDGKGAFRPIAETIARDKASLTDAHDNWTARARALDAMSLAQYLRQFRGAAPDWTIDLLDLAYWGEYGMPTDRQSSLNLVDFITTEGEFSMFGKSDEVFRIAGGSSALPDALLKRLARRVALERNHKLVRLAPNGDGMSLSFESSGAPAVHDAVIVAIPFTTLRDVEGLDALGLAPAKLKAIRELGYGDNAKVMVGTRGRPWTSAGTALPAPSDGEFYSEDFQVVWDTSRGQNGTRGILTNYLTGVEDQTAAVANLQSGLRAILPAIADSLDPSEIAAFFWAEQPFTRGSFGAPRIGQYTTLLEVAGTPELGGRLHFAGEHTSTDFGGFMCGGVQSGERAAAAILAQTGQKAA